MNRSRKNPNPNPSAPEIALPGASYSVTIRLSETVMRALASAAALAGKSPSTMARLLLSAALAPGATIVQTPTRKAGAR